MSNSDRTEEMVESLQPSVSTRYNARRNRSPAVVLMKEDTTVEYHTFGDDDDFNDDDESREDNTLDEEVEALQPSVSTRYNARRHTAGGLAKEDTTVNYGHFDASHEDEQESRYADVDDAEDVETLQPSVSTRYNARRHTTGGLMKEDTTVNYGHFDNHDDDEADSHRADVDQEDDYPEEIETLQPSVSTRFNARRHMGGGLMKEDTTVNYSTFDHPDDDGGDQQHGEEDVFCPTSPATAAAPEAAEPEPEAMVAEQPRVDADRHRRRSRLASKTGATLREELLHGLESAPERPRRPRSSDRSRAPTGDVNAKEGHAAVEDDCVESLQPSESTRIYLRRRLSLGPRRSVLIKEDTTVDYGDGAPRDHRSTDAECLAASTAAAVDDTEDVETLQPPVSMRYNARRHTAGGLMKEDTTVNYVHFDQDSHYADADEEEDHTEEMETLQPSVSTRFNARRHIGGGLMKEDTTVNYSTFHPDDGGGDSIGDEAAAKPESEGSHSSAEATSSNHENQHRVEADAAEKEQVAHRHGGNETNVAPAAAPAHVDHKDDHDVRSDGSLSATAPHDNVHSSPGPRHANVDVESEEQTEPSRGQSRESGVSRGLPSALDPSRTSRSATPIGNSPIPTSTPKVRTSNVLDIESEVGSPQEVDLSNPTRADEKKKGIAIEMVVSGEDDNEHSVVPPMNVTSDAAAEEGSDMHASFKPTTVPQVTVRNAVDAIIARARANDRNLRTIDLRCTVAGNASFSARSSPRIPSHRPPPGMSPLSTSYIPPPATHIAPLPAVVGSESDTITHSGRSSIPMVTPGRNSGGGPMLSERRSSTPGQCSLISPEMSAQRGGMMSPGLSPSMVYDYSATSNVFRGQMATPLSDDALRALSEALSFNRVAQQLDLSSNCLTPTGPILWLLSALAANPKSKLEVLSVAHNPLLDDDFGEKLLECVLQNASIKQIDLSGTSLSLAVAEEVIYAASLNAFPQQLKGLCVRARRNDPTLLEFVVRDDPSDPKVYSEAALDALINALRHNNTVRSLSLDKCCVGDHRTTALAPLLQESPYLTKLSLKDNDIGIAGVEALCDALDANRNAKLELLDLTNNDLDDEAALTLAATASGHPHLKSVLFEGNPKIGTVPMMKLKAATELNCEPDALKAAVPLILENDPGIDRLNLRGGPKQSSEPGRGYYTSLGCKTLAHALKMNTHVHTIDFSGNHLGPEACLALGQLFRANKTVTSLDISENPLNDEGARHLLQGLEVNDSIVVLNATDCGVSDRLLQGLEGVCRLNKQPLPIKQLYMLPPQSPDAPETIDASRRDQPMGKHPQLTWESLKLLRIILTRQRHVTATLDISGNTLADEDVETICYDLIEPDLPLSTLRMNNCGLSEQAVAMCCTSMEKNYHLTSLFIGDNPDVPFSMRSKLDDCLETMRYPRSFKDSIPRILRNDETLTVIEAIRPHGDKSYAIGDKGCSILSEAIESNEHVTTLRLVNQDVSDAGLKRLCEAFRQVVNITSVDLSDNMIGNEGIVALGSALASGHTGLKELKLSRNTIRAEGGEALLRALYCPLSRHLKELDIEGNPLPPTTKHDVMARLAMARQPWEFQARFAKYRPRVAIEAAIEAAEMGHAIPGIDFSQTLRAELGASVGNSGGNSPAQSGSKGTAPPSLLQSPMASHGVSNRHSLTVPDAAGQSTGSPGLGGGGGGSKRDSTSPVVRRSLTTFVESGDNHNNAGTPSEGATPSNHRRSISDGGFIQSFTQSLSSPTSRHVSPTAASRNTTDHPPAALVPAGPPGAALRKGKIGVDGMEFRESILKTNANGEDLPDATAWTFANASAMTKATSTVWDAPTLEMDADTAPLTNGALEALRGVIQQEKAALPIGDYRPACKRLSFTNHKLSSGCLGYLRELLELLPACAFVDLSGNRIEEDACPALLKLLADFRTIVKFKLDRNPLEDDKKFMLAFNRQVRANRQVDAFRAPWTRWNNGGRERRLNMKDANVNDDGVILLLETVADTEPIDVEHPEWGRRLKAGVSACPVVVIIDLTGNPRVTDASIVYLCGWVACAAPNLHEIRLDGTGASSIGVDALRHLVSSQQSIVAASANDCTSVSLFASGRLGATMSMASVSLALSTTPSMTPVPAEISPDGRSRPSDADNNAKDSPAGADKAQEGGDATEKPFTDPKDIDLSMPPPRPDAVDAGVSGGGGDAAKKDGSGGKRTPGTPGLGMTQRQSTQHIIDEEAAAMDAALAAIAAAVAVNNSRPRGSIVDVVMRRRRQQRDIAVTDKGQLYNFVDDEGEAVIEANGADVGAGRGSGKQASSTTPRATAAATKYKVDELIMSDALEQMPKREPYVRGQFREQARGNAGAGW